MSDYVIDTDSACDINPEILVQCGVSYASMFFSFHGEEKEYTDNDMDITAFYNRMRDGGIASTSAINPSGFIEAFKHTLEDGKDILYLGLSGSLSTTYNSARIAADELLSLYPDRKIITVDTLSASAGIGMLVYLAVQKKATGASIEDVAAYIENLKLKICHWFVVDDLTALKRGGRISPTVAFVGSVLSIKPILHVNNDGKPINVSKIRGKKSAMSFLADKYGELAEQPEKGTVYISHADSGEDADRLAMLLKERYGIEVQLITNIGTVLGSHTGPGAIALFFVGKER